MSVDLVRQHWLEGHRGVLEARAGQPQLYARLLEQIEIVTAELRRRIGRSFTLDELAREYAGSDRWAREAIEDRPGGPGWIVTAVTATDAAFYLYARGARDYSP
jgi:hypothetical protein